MDSFSHSAFVYGRIDEEEAVGAREGLGVPLEPDLPVLVQVVLVAGNTGVEDRVQALPVGAGEIQLDEVLDLGAGVDFRFAQRGREVVQLVGVGLAAEDRRAVVVREREFDAVAVVQEVEDERIVLLGVRAIEARERLHGLDAGQRLVDVHGVQQRLVVAGLELVGDDQEPIGVLLNLLGDGVRREPVEGRLGDRAAVVLVLS